MEERQLVWPTSVIFQLVKNVFLVSKLSYAYPMLLCQISSFFIFFLFFKSRAIIIYLLQVVKTLQSTCWAVSLVEIDMWDDNKQLHILEWAANLYSAATFYIH